MNESKKKVAEEKQATNELVVLNSETVGKIIESGNLAEVLKSKKRVGFSLTSEYLSMEKNEIRRFVVVQKTTLTVDIEGSDEKKDIEAILMIDENGETISAAQTVLVNSIKGSLPCLVEIVCKGDVALKGGRKYTDFDVFLLDNK